MCDIARTSCSLRSIFSISKISYNFVFITKGNTNQRSFVVAIFKLIKLLTSFIVSETLHHCICPNLDTYKFTKTHNKIMFQLISSRFMRQCWKNSSVGLHNQLSTSSSSITGRRKVSESFQKVAKRISVD